MKLASNMIIFTKAPFLKPNSIYVATSNAIFHLLYTALEVIFFVTFHGLKYF